MPACRDVAGGLEVADDGGDVACAKGGDDLVLMGCIGLPEVVGIASVGDFDFGADGSVCDACPVMVCVAGGVAEAGDSLAVAYAEIVETPRCWVDLFAVGSTRIAGSAEGAAAEAEIGCCVGYGETGK